ncbi:hypothetical protein DSI35_28285 [Mycobacterium tuberculosis]|uniref:Uncharacterized protein n=12 Tax=Mycobacterium tuberculosis complex TaxID=77643 RepID=P71917_MYCTU|nr:MULTISPECIES: hypothetical protein [Mycobacterium]NP_216948.1 hypothetical protein Rv2432c [Mycobacterium tuberculosis H37Rv]EFO74264.1 hypothetical protein TMAG_02992 [Mycobacterium tuberculosis SUMu001]EFP54150.1 hypothetical protein TMLG_02188 [Mycobacterium tuberculosis SUMu012]EPZ65496.1 hypothetical protein TBKG_00833 [Mycobacterium tuberculosis '98-R604 INH-RIF-EM']KAK26349.1 hypothetical protein AZ55_14355 [Mycobacterium tuberculosis CWCFVRF MDRTB 670]KAM30822.1 hypothetical protei
MTVRAEHCRGAGGCDECPSVMPEHPTALFHDVAAIALAQPGAEPGAMMGFPCRPALLPHLSRAVMRCVRTRSASTSLGVSVIAGQLPAAGSRHRLGAPCRHVRWWLASDGHWGMVSYIPTALNVSMGGIVGWRCVP